MRRGASYQQSFNEIARGERFVEDVLRAKVRRRERRILRGPLGVHGARAADVAVAPARAVARMERSGMRERFAVW